MSFTSLSFLFVFLPGVLAGFAVVSRWGPAPAMGCLILGSLAFYAASNPCWLPVLLASLLANALLGRWIRGTEAKPRTQTAILAGGIALNLIGMAVGRSLGAVPPGISFIAFTQIGFLLDQRGEGTDPFRPLSYPLLVVFFPHLIAGPILRVRDVSGQFRDPATWRLSGENLAAGSFLFLIGLLKKTLLADPLTTIVAPGFADPASLGLLEAWGTALAWSFHLYFDFSGYSDMAIGLARLFGVRFPVNFASPYKAQSVIDYWQRWHMTLTRFLMSTVYNPLALAVMRWRRARGWPTDRAAQRSLGGFCSMMLAPLVVTMGLAGVWHGAGLTFLVFGLLHAGFLGINHAWRVFRPGVRSGAWQAVIARVTLTYLCVLVGAVIFRAPSMEIAGTLLRGMAGFGAGHSDAGDAYRTVHALWLAGLGAIVWGMPNTQQIMDGGTAWPRWRPNTSWAVAAGCAASLALLSLGGTGAFVYFQF